MLSYHLAWSLVVLFAAPEINKTDLISSALRNIKIVGLGTRLISLAFVLYPSKVYWPVYSLLNFTPISLA